jgi:Ca2+-binding EF-hand superfamily protein
MYQHKVKKTHPCVKDLDEMELFRTFKKYDRNSNGTLSFSEYSRCL